MKNLKMTVLAANITSGTSNCSATHAKDGTPAGFAMMKWRIIISIDEKQRTCYVCCVDMPKLPHSAVKNAESRLRSITVMFANFGTMIVKKAFIIAMIVGFAVSAKVWAKTFFTAR